MFRQERRLGFARIGYIELEGKYRTPLLIDYLEKPKILECIDFGKAPTVLEEIDKKRFEVLRSKDENFVIATGLSTLNPKKLVEYIYKLRTSTYKPLYTVALAKPSNIPLLFYMGVDIFDNILAIVKGYQGIYMTEFEEIDADKVKEPMCCCPSCVNGDFSEEGLAKHNTFVMKRVLNMSVRENLRNFVEAWVKFDPNLTAMLRFFDKLNQAYHPRFSKARVVMTTEHSFTRPEVRYFLSRAVDCYEPKGKALLILPCSAKKPYSKSRSHTVIRRALGEVWKRGIEEVIVSSPLVVPRVYELTYPAVNYDVAVSGDWSRDEVEFVSEWLSRFVEKGNFEVVIGHVVGGYKEVVERTAERLGIDVVWTAERDVTDQSSLRRLKEVIESYEFEGYSLYKSMFNHMLRYQFDFDFEIKRVRGKYPNLEFYVDGRVARIDLNYGCLDIDLALAKHLIKKAYYVEIDDFKPKGTIFAVGVKKADERIRPNDIVVFYNDRYLGVGRSLMCGREMVENDGKAVEVKKVGLRDLQND
ncbi:archaeosine synthase subunit alpha [Archaeoglobus sp.]